MFNKTTLGIGLILIQFLFSCNQKDCLIESKTIEPVDSSRFLKQSFNHDDIVVSSFNNFVYCQNSTGETVILDSMLQIKDRFQLQNGVEIYGNSKYIWKGNLDFGVLTRQNISNEKVDTFKVETINDSLIIFNNYLFPPVEFNGYLYGLVRPAKQRKIDQTITYGKFKINDKNKILSEFSIENIKFDLGTEGNYYTFPNLTETPQGLWISTSVGAQAFSIKENKMYDFSEECLPKSDSFALADINDFNIIRKHSLLNPNYKFIGTIRNEIFFVYQQALPYSDSLFKVTPEQKLLKINKDTKHIESFDIPKNILKNTLFIKDNYLKYLSYAKDNSLYWHTIKF